MEQVPNKTESKSISRHDAHLVTSVTAVEEGILAINVGWSSCHIIHQFSPKRIESRVVSLGCAILVGLKVIVALFHDD